MNKSWQEYVDDPEAAPWHVRYHGCLSVLVFAVAIPAVGCATVFRPSLSYPIAGLMIAALLGLFLAGAVRQRRERVRSYRRVTRRCLDCGYALTGNLSGVCPECGSRL
jgi:hypothetical protein